MIVWYPVTRAAGDTCEETLAREQRGPRHDDRGIGAHVRRQNDLRYPDSRSWNTSPACSRRAWKWLPAGKVATTRGGLQALSDPALSQRIRNLPRATLGCGAPKRMSVAGAQYMLLVVYRDNALFEPVGSEPSTHILKPDHGGDAHPASSTST